MKRRRFLAGVSGLASTGGLALGTGAFTSVSAERNLEVRTAADDEALLSLRQLGSGERSESDGTPGTVEFSFPGDERRLSNPSLGLGTDSVYEFDRDAEETGQSATEGLLRIQNNGTQPVEVYAEQQTDSDLEIELYDVTDADKTALRDNPAVLNVGEHVDVGFRIRTTGTNLGTHDETLTIVAEATND